MQRGKKLFGVNAGFVADIHPDFLSQIIETKISSGRIFVSAERLELSTNGLKGHCSTIELRAHKAKSILTWYTGQSQRKTRFTTKNAKNLKYFLRELRG